MLHDGDHEEADALAKHFLLDAPPIRRVPRLKMLLQLANEGSQ
jgi:hypothetical protein